MRIGILGGGFAGLSVAHALRDSGFALDIYEQDATPGGLARSFLWHGIYCDLAPHRLFTTDQDVLRELLDLVPMRRLRRQSRIYIQGRWIQDPVNAVEMVMKFLPGTSIKLVWHYLFRDKHAEDSFEALVLNKFGKTLNRLFFKPYSEKLFGIPAAQISPSWGHKKIRVGGLRDMIRRKSKLYFKDFYYPRSHGYGAIAAALLRDVRSHVHTNHRLVSVTPLSGGAYECAFEHEGRTVRATFDVLVSSLPLPAFSRMLGLDLQLAYRPARLTYLLVRKPRVSGNHWFYFADSDFMINRVAEFRNFSPSDPAADKTVLCCETTDLRRYTPEHVIEELARVNLIRRDDVLDTKVIGVDCAYPIYNRGYEKELERSSAFYAHHPNIHHVGRQAAFAHRDVDEIYMDAKATAHGILSRSAKDKGGVKDHKHAE